MDKVEKDVQSLLQGMFAGADLSGAQIIAYNDGEVNYIKTGSERSATTLSEEKIVEAIRYILGKKGDDGKFVLTHNYQWFAIQRVLAVYADYPAQTKSFVNKMANLGFGKDDKLTYDSLIKAPETTPLLARNNPEIWDSYKNRSEQYEAQYIVADLLMKELGIKG